MTCLNVGDHLLAVFTRKIEVNCSNLFQYDASRKYSNVDTHLVKIMSLALMVENFRVLGNLYRGNS